MIGLITTLATGLINWGRERTQQRAELKRIDHQGELNRRQARADAASQLDRQSLAHITWEDGYLILLFTLPLCVLFSAPLLALIWPGALQMNEAMLSGFTALKATPEEYRYALGLIFVYVFGFRRCVASVLERLAKGGR